MKEVALVLGPGWPPLSAVPGEPGAGGDAAASAGCAAAGGYHTTCEEPGALLASGPAVSAGSAQAGDCGDEGFLVEHLVDKAFAVWRRLVVQVRGAGGAAVLKKAVQESSYGGSLSEAPGVPQQEQLAADAVPAERAGGASIKYEALGEMNEDGIVDTAVVEPIAKNPQERQRRPQRKRQTKKSDARSQDEDRLVQLIADGLGKADPTAAQQTASAAVTKALAGVPAASRAYVIEALSDDVRGVV